MTFVTVAARLTRTGVRGRLGKVEAFWINESRITAGAAEAIEHGTRHVDREVVAFGDMCPHRLHH